MNYFTLFYAKWWYQCTEMSNLSASLFMLETALWFGVLCCVLLYVTLCYVVCCSVLLCVAFCCVALCVAFCYVLLCLIVLCCVPLFRMLYCVLLCCVLCSVVSCRVVLCCLFCRVLLCCLVFPYQLPMLCRSKLRFNLVLCFVVYVRIMGSDCYSNRFPCVP